MISVSVLRKDAFNLGLFALSFSIPFGYSIAIICLYVFFAFWIVSSKSQFKAQFNYTDLLIIVFISYSFFFDFTLNSVSPKIWEKNVLIILMPILLVFNRPNRLFNVCKFFVLGNFFMLIACFLISFYRSFSFVHNRLSFDPILSTVSSDFIQSSIYGGNYFFGDFFSFFLHPTYSSIYLNFSIFILILWSFKVKRIKSFNLFLIGFFVSGVFFNSSKAGLLSLSLLGLSMYIFSLICFKLKPIKLILMLAFFFIFSFFFLSYHPRIQVLYNDVVSGKLFESGNYSNQSRIAIWNASIGLSIANPMGFGVSSVQEKLDSVYSIESYNVPLTKHYNSHNQFLTIALSSGVLGLSLFFLFLFSCFKRAISTLNSYHRGVCLAFLCILILNFMFETLLGRFEGILFFSFFYSILFKNHENLSFD